MDKKMNGLVCTHHLNKTFFQGSQSVLALNNIELSIDHGEFVAVMGASGSGKSTLLHVLAGLLEPDNGSQVTVSGLCYTGVKEKVMTRFRLEHIGLVYQNYNLVRSLNVRENIRLPLLFLKNPEDQEKKLDRLIEDLSLGHRAKHLPRQLSGGEQQRVAIGRAMITEPKLILADEPTGNLDITSGNQICRVLKQLNRESGHTIIMVTHAPHIAYHANRIIMLSEGSIVCDVEKQSFGDSVELSVYYQRLLQEKSPTEQQVTS